MGQPGKYEYKKPSDSATTRQRDSAFGKLIIPKTTTSKTDRPQADQTHVGVTMTTLRRFEMNDLFKFNNVNLDVLTAVSYTHLTLPTKA